MKIRFLGTHQYETATTRLACLLIDDFIALDAGALTSSLSLTHQEKIRQILLTHRHWDHIRDLPSLTNNTQEAGTLKVYGVADTLDSIASHLMDGTLYPNFLTRQVGGKPIIELDYIQPPALFSIRDYTVRAISMHHGVPSVGYQVSRADSRRLFYTGDTGPVCSDVWDQIQPDILVIDTTYPNRMEENARDQGHLTPHLLLDELKSFQRVRGYLPEVIATHLCPPYEEEIRRQIAIVGEEFGTAIYAAQEGMELSI